VDGWKDVQFGKTTLRRWRSFYSKMLSLGTDGRNGCCRRQAGKQTHLGTATHSLQDQTDTGFGVSSTSKRTCRARTSGCRQCNRQILRRSQQKGPAEASPSRAMGRQNNGTAVNRLSGIRIGLRSGLSTSNRLLIGILEHRGLGRRGTYS
jgi:hypothetical protein